MAPAEYPEKQGEAAPETSGATPDWTELAERVRQGDEAATEALYRRLREATQFYLRRHLKPEDIEDRFHNMFVIVLQALQRGELRDTERLIGFVHTVLKRQVAAQIDRAVRNRRQFADLDAGSSVSETRLNPEETAIASEKVLIMEKVLRGLKRRDREILIRFYLEEQTEEQICKEMNLTETQLHLLKSRAKARFGELGRRKLERRTGFLQFFLKNRGR